MKSEWYYINDIDFPWDDLNESFEIMLEKLAKEVPSAFVKVNKFVGSGGGWPQGEIIVHSNDVKKLFEFFGQDDIEWAIEHFCEPIEKAV